MSRAYSEHLDALAWNPPPDEPPPDDEGAMAAAFGEAGWTAGEIEERENQRRKVS